MAANTCRQIPTPCIKPSQKSGGWYSCNQWAYFKRSWSKILQSSNIQKPEVSGLSALWCPLVVPTLIHCHHNWALHRWNIWPPLWLQRRASLCRSPAKQSRSQSFPRSTSCNRTNDGTTISDRKRVSCVKYKQWWELLIVLIVLSVCLPDEVKRLLFVKAEKSGPVPVQVVALALTFSISGPFPITTLKGEK